MNVFSQLTRSAGRNRLPIGGALLDVGVIAGGVLAVVPVLRRRRLAVAGGAIIGVPGVVTVTVVRSVPSQSATPPAVEPAVVPKAVMATEMRAVKPAGATSAHCVGVKAATAEPATMERTAAAEAAAMEAAAEAPAVTAAAPAAMRGFSGNWLDQCHNARERYNGNTQTACNADRFHSAYSSRSLPEWQLVKDGSKAEACRPSSPEDEIAFNRHWLSRAAPPP